MTTTETATATATKKVVVGAALLTRRGSPGLGGFAELGASGHVSGLRCTGS